MNRGHVFQSSPVQQMMAESPNLWIINNAKPPSHPNSSFLVRPPGLFPLYAPPPPPPPPQPPSSASHLPLSSSWNDNQELPESWSQLLLGGLVGEEDRSGLSNMQQAKKLENWEEQFLHHHHRHQQTPNSSSVVDVKQESNSVNSYAYGGHGNNVEFQAAKPPAPWSQIMPVSSPKSCVTTLSSSNLLDFSTKSDARHPPPDHSSECNSTATGGLPKKARVQPSSTQSTFKVRKEKLGDRITALHQLVSPFGKTDTASVLLEAIGHIRFLQSQIEALSLPYLGNGSGNMRQQHPVQGERNCLFPEDPGQLLNDNCMKKKGTSDQDPHEPKKDLRSRGLCLVPISCTLQVGSDNAADYWAPSLGGGGFR